MEFDYFYGPGDAEQYQFYRIPKLLITSERFKDVSVESKLLYGLILDQLSLSIKNGWFDSLNRAYIIYTVEDVMEDIAWASFVLPAKSDHENQYGKGLWAKIPADGHTTLPKPYLSGQSDDGKNI